MNKFEYVVNDIEEFLKVTKEESTKVESKNMEKLIGAKDKIKIFKNIKEDDLKAIIYDLKFLRFNYKDKILEQDTQSNNIYYLLNGSCDVFKNGYKIGQIHSGNSFGESGALFNQKRNATVMCSSDTATLLSFKIDTDNLDYSSAALSILYKNLAFEINMKLNEINNLHMRLLSSY